MFETTLTFKLHRKSLLLKNEIMKLWKSFEHVDIELMLNPFRRNKNHVDWKLRCCNRVFLKSNLENDFHVRKVFSFSLLLYIFLQRMASGRWNGSSVGKPAASARSLCKTKNTNTLAAFTVECGLGSTTTWLASTSTRTRRTLCWSKDRTKARRCSLNSTRFSKHVSTSPIQRLHKHNHGFS